MPFRFVHTADLHLDSPLRSLALREPALAELVATASRAALTRIVDLCLEERGDALLVAGDLTDGAQTSIKTARFLVSELARATVAGVRVFVIRGNHDARARATRGLLWPEGVTVFGSRDAPVRLDGAADGRDVLVHGVSFADPTCATSLLPRYAPPEADALSVGLMHTSLGGSEGHDAYAPVSESALAEAGYAYWALGHIHRPMHHRRSPAIVMAGIPQGRDIGEAGARTVTLAALSGDGTVALETRSVALARFERVDVALTEAGRRAAISAALETLRAVAEDVPEEHLIVRLGLHVQGDGAWRLIRDRDLVEADLREALAGSGIWLERADVAATTPQEAPGAASGSAAGELARLVTRDVLPDPGFAASAGEIAEALVRDLPGELRDAFGSQETDRADRLGRLAAQGAAEILARLASDGDEPALSEDD
ncbi:MAG: exonuclease SbcCD subunit D [Paracoccaceae bacterium]